MTLPSVTGDRALSIYLALAQYPILRTLIRARMRRELFERGVITPQAFEAEVRQKAIESQAREGLHNPFEEEPPDVWETRLARIRTHLTDFYFAYNLPYELFEQIVREVLAERGQRSEDLLVAFNPELAPQDMVFEQGIALERLPPAERSRFEARLREIKVVLIRTSSATNWLISTSPKSGSRLLTSAKSEGTRSDRGRSAARQPACSWRRAS
mgnify:CR=1 FL=1